MCGRQGAWPYSVSIAMDGAAGKRGAITGFARLGLLIVRAVTWGWRFVDYWSPLDTDKKTGETL